MIICQSGQWQASKQGLTDDVDVDALAGRVVVGVAEGESTRVLVRELHARAETSETPWGVRPVAQIPVRVWRGSRSKVSYWVTVAAMVTTPSSEMASTSGLARSALRASVPKVPAGAGEG